MNRHRFEPARLLTGVLLLAAGLAYLLDAVGVLALPAAVLAALVPLALLTGAVAGLLVYGWRGLRARRTAKAADRHLTP